MWRSGLQYRFEDSFYSLVLICISPCIPHRNAEVTNCDCLMSPRNVTSPLNDRVRGLGFAGIWQSTQYVWWEENWEPLAGHFKAAVPSQLKNKPFRMRLSLNCFALLSPPLFTGTKAAGLAPFLPREYCDSPAEVVLLGQSKGGFMPPLAEQRR